MWNPGATRGTCLPAINMEKKTPPMSITTLSTECPYCSNPAPRGHCAPCNELEERIYINPTATAYILTEMWEKNYLNDETVAALQQLAIKNLTQ